MGNVVIIGGTRGIGRELAAELARRGDDIIIAGRSAERANAVAGEISSMLVNLAGSVRGTAADLSEPHGLAVALNEIAEVDHLILAGMVRDQNSLGSYDINGAIELAIVKVIGYTTALHILKSRISPNGSVLLFGGISKDVPYPGSTTMTAVNNAVVGLVATFAREMAPVRVNAIHPGVVSDSPMWAGNNTLLADAQRRTIIKRLPTMSDIVDGCLFLMKNPAATAINLSLDGGRI
jgi:NAD(P)-dependent dehydrogenase (short-subunit alcohol dehydrogenase family)